MFVSKFFDLLNFKKGDLYWPWRKYPILAEREVKCEVVDIQYQFPKLRNKKIKHDLKNFLTIIMSIKLKILDKNIQEEMEDSDKVFEVKYFPVNDVPSFFIWHYTYEKRVREDMNA